jgi:small subunit ribosomal protein S6
MTAQAPTYDLMLLLDPLAEESARAKVLSDVTEAIGAQGELLRDDRWGERPLAYQIEHRPTAEYHLLQFHVSRTELLDQLTRALHIADGVLRFRIVRLEPGTPEITKAPSTATSRAARPQDTHEDAPQAA